GRGGVDDGAALLRQHLLQDVLQPEEHAAHVHGHDLIEHRLVVVGDVGDLALDAGVVVEAVDAAIGVDRLLYVCLHGLRVGYVSLDEQRLAALLAHDAGRRLATRRVAIDDDDLGAAAGEAQRRRPPDAVAAAGDQRDLVLELHGAFLLYRLLATVTQARGDAIDAEMDTLHDLGRGVAGAMAAQQLDLHVVQRVDVGEAVPDRARQRGVGLKQGLLAGEGEDRVDRGLPLLTHAAKNPP